jgi:Tat protein translocase TatB subunit
MFDVSFPELLLVTVIGLLVLGPQRLPKVAAEIGKWVGRARRTASQLRRQLEREIELSELETPPSTKPTTPPPDATPSPPPPTQNPEVIASELPQAAPVVETGEANSIGGAPREPSSSADQPESR